MERIPCPGTSFGFPLPPSRLIVLALAVSASLLVPAPSFGLTIKSATITTHPVKGDAFSVKGELGPTDPPGLDLGGAVNVVFEIDGMVAGFRSAELKRTKTRLSYKGPSKSPGIGQLVLDLKKRRFAAKGTGLILSGVPGRVIVRLRADDDTACALVPMERLGKPPKQPPTKPKAVRYGLPRKQQGAPCLIAGHLSSHPSRVVVGTPTSVRFEAVLAPGIVPDANGARVQRFEAGAAVGPPLCTLADDGGPASDDLVAGDGLYTCTATIAAAALGTQSFVATATVGGTTLVSAALAVPIVPPPTDADVMAMFAAQTAARHIWDDLAATLGDTLNARLAAIRQIAALPDVADVRLGANGLDLDIRYTSGFRGGLMLNGRFGTLEADTLQRAPATAGEAASDAGPPQPRAIVRSCPVRPERTLIGNHNALLLRTSYFANEDDWPLAEEAFKGSCLGIDPTVQILTVTSILAAGAGSALFISTHGVMNADGRIEIVTDETATPTDIVGLGQHQAPYNADEILVLGIPQDKVGGGRNVWTLRPAYLRHIIGKMDHGFVHLSHCHGAEDPSEAAAFRSKGAETVFAFDNVVSNKFAQLATKSIVTGLAQHLLTSGEAFERTTKNDPWPEIRDSLAKGSADARTGGAVFRMLGNERLAYVEKPKLTPASSTIESGQSVPLASAVLGKGSCELVHDWDTTAVAGHLDDGQGNAGGSFKSLSATVTYQAEPDGVGTDDLSVQIRAPGDPPPPFFGEACATVEVKGCGDNKKNGSEECDGDDAAACPGKCLSDCKCRRDPACGNGVKEPGEICDGDDREICDDVSAGGVGHCHPDCHGCAQCGDGVVDPNEECDPGDDSPCPNACRGNCTCGCAPGDPAGCPADACCNFLSKDCCTPRRVDSDPACFATASGCCGNQGHLEPDFCQGPGGPSVCPDEECNDRTFYWCYVCDNKFMDGFCDIDAGCSP